MGLTEAQQEALLSLKCNGAELETPPDELGAAEKIAGQLTELRATSPIPPPQRRTENRARLLAEAARFKQESLATPVRRIRFALNNLRWRLGL